MVTLFLPAGAGLGIAGSLNATGFGWHKKKLEAIETLVIKIVDFKSEVRLDLRGHLEARAASEATYSKSSAKSLLGHQTKKFNTKSLQFWQSHHLET